MISINSTLLIQAALFIFLALILNQIFFKPFLRFLEGRQTRIREDEAKAAKFEETAEQRRLQVEEGLRKGHLQALEEKERIHNAGTEAGKHVIQTTHQEVEAELRTIKAQIAEESQQALSELQRGHGQMAQKIAEKILGRELR
jgi:F-type H+-transporting ATPase subunit b